MPTIVLVTTRPVRAADVAKRAGVSVTTVSFVFGGKARGNVSAATQERILQVADELGYRPNKLAQSLRHSRTHTIALLTDGIASSPFAGRLLAAAEQRASELGQALLLRDTHFRSERDQEALDDFASRRVDAVVYATMGLQRLVDLPTTPLPLVLANCFQEPARHPSAIPDEVAVGQAAARLLTSTGHRHIVMLSGPGRPGHGTRVVDVAAARRARGFRAGLRSTGVARAAGEVRVCGWTIGDGYRGAVAVLTADGDRLAAASDRPTSIFAVNDRVATGALLAALRLGVRVPHELSIVGVDDQEELADQTVPALTTYRLPHEALGTWAVDTALDMITRRRRTAADPAVDAPRLFPFELIERDTVAPPPAT
ncbi:Transcriptional regulator [Nostocoides australiense Ben110]|uniref:Transcriptional regulator n=1 Tax=Nostocoides australiense Ben110 TaxID=1193182 RepID=W6JTL5_9MICO|nr:Transcriptional regulator [Tetrasphaera australiensis Ben110]